MRLVGRRARRAVAILGIVLGFAACGPPDDPAEAPEATPRPESVGSSDPASVSITTATRVVLLGTGTPVPDPERSGPAVAIVVSDRVYLVDAGAGIMRRAAAAYEAGLFALRLENLDRLFVTHLHSDHTVGIPELLHMGWIQGRPSPLQVYGPPGVGAMAHHIEQAWVADVEIRREGAEERRGEGYRIESHEIAPGEVYRDELVRVVAFEVEHGRWEHAYGYRFDTPDRRIVISGDATPSEAVVEACDGCDLLLHEVYSATTFALLGPEAQAYHSSFHTSTEELGALATRARARKLVLYHQLYFGADDQMLVEEIRGAGFRGELESGEDLGVY